MTHRLLSNTAKMTDVQVLCALSCEISRPWISDLSVLRLFNLISVKCNLSMIHSLPIHKIT